MNIRPSIIDAITSFKAFDEELMSTHTLVRDAHGLFLNTLKAHLIEGFDVRQALEEATKYHDVVLNPISIPNLIRSIESIAFEIRLHIPNYPIAMIDWHDRLSGQFLVVYPKVSTWLEIPEDLLNYPLNISMNKRLKLITNVFNAILDPNAEALFSDTTKWYSITSDDLNWFRNYISAWMKNHLRGLSPHAYASYVSKNQANLYGLKIELRVSS